MDDLKLFICQGSGPNRFTGTPGGGGVTTIYEGTGCAIFGVPFFQQKINFGVPFLVKSQVVINFGVSF